MISNSFFNRKPCSVAKMNFDNDSAIWHVHSQYELSFLCVKDGYKQIGNHNSRVSGNQVLLVPPNTPYLYTSSGKSENEYIISVSFDANIFDGKGNIFNYAPFADIINLLRKSDSGMCFSNECVRDLLGAFESMLDCDEFEQSIKLLRILNRLAKDPGYGILSSLGNNTSGQKYCNSKRMTDVINYISMHFRENISLQTIADVANMTPPAFCKYFKRATKKTFVRFVNEFRLHYARSLMLNNDYTISQICYESGFNSMTNFNRQFRKATSMSPIDYRSKVLATIAI